MGGFKKSTVTYNPLQNVNICWVSRQGLPFIELVKPVSETSLVCKIKKQSVTPYHICYFVDNIDSAEDERRRMKYILVSNPMKAIAVQNSRVCFLFDKNIGMIELDEAPAAITE